MAATPADLTETGSALDRTRKRTLAAPDGFQIPKDSFESHVDSSTIIKQGSGGTGHVGIRRKMLRGNDIISIHICGNE